MKPRDAGAGELDIYKIRSKQWKKERVDIQEKRKKSKINTKETYCVVSSLSKDW
jgi:hypothetical protein